VTWRAHDYTEQTYLNGARFAHVQLVRTRYWYWYAVDPLRDVSGVGYEETDEAARAAAEAVLCRDVPEPDRRAILLEAANVDCRKVLP